MRPAVANMIVVVIVFAALALGSTIGVLVGIEIGESRNQDIRECILDVLIEPPERADPVDRYRVWTAGRLEAECSVADADAIRD
jgi:hypothetical protein